MSHYPAYPHAAEGGQAPPKAVGWALTQEAEDERSKKFLGAHDDEKFGGTGGGFVWRAGGDKWWGGQREGGWWPQVRKEGRQ